jgi:hypothetical protein
LIQRNFMRRRQRQRENGGLGSAALFGYGPDGTVGIG